MFSLVMSTSRSAVKLQRVILKRGQMNRTTSDIALPSRNFRAIQCLVHDSDLACTRPAYTVDLRRHQVSRLELCSPDVETLTRGYRGPHTLE
ncbi:hypothetical protein AVEN_154048-1 [Araneus ventricosus]|uniref:Uncharacterized protein n=1 Tax=Araneus ventricosus TaxID=182803 RepID=A0A4Y2TWP3_ARAVE|nr:hypothetical protein AVEN_154048-1 [Araneus ventricosus]